MSRLRIGQHGLNTNFNKVSAIKAVRTLTGLGLKQAKDAVESAMEGEVVDLGNTIPREDPAANHEALDTIRTEGLDIVYGDTKTDFVLKAVTESARMATADGETELAILLLNVIKQHKENIARKEAEYRAAQEVHRQYEHNEKVRAAEATRIREENEDRHRAQERRRIEEEERRTSAYAPSRSTYR